MRRRDIKITGEEIFRHPSIILFEVISIQANKSSVSLEYESKIEKDKNSRSINMTENMNE